MKHNRYAHRGLHDRNAGIPENSLAAFRRAIAHGFGSELDVHLLKGGTLAVFHDSNLRRMTGTDGIIEHLNAAALDALTLDGTREYIPQLCEVLALYEGTGLPLLVELKSSRGNSAALAARAVAALDRYHVPYLIESFDPRCLLWLRRCRPEIARGQLAMDFTRGLEASSGYGYMADRMLTRMAFNGKTRPAFVSYRFEDRGVPALRRALRRASPEVFYWTIRSREDMEEAEREGARVIFEGFVPASDR